jgi:S1-C subfamily serine protease
LLALTACAHRASTAAASDRYTDLYTQLHPSVALITMQIPADDPKRKGQWDEAYGSGAIVASGTWGSRILTDAHVVADARRLRAKIGDAGKTVPLRVIATSDDDDDLAILEIATPNLPPVTLGDMTHVVPGRAVGVLGYPIPDAFEDEHLRAAVSLYTGRIASVRNGTIEIDVPIIPGESGGPVFDAQTGLVIGLAESRFDDERAIGFATPVDIIVRFLAAHPRR